MQSAITRRPAICGRCGAPRSGASPRPQGGRGMTRLSRARGRWGDWEVPQRILSAATLLDELLLKPAIFRGLEVLEVIEDPANGDDPLPLLGGGNGLAAPLGTGQALADGLAGGFGFVLGLIFG